MTNVLHAKKKSNSKSKLVGSIILDIFIYFAIAPFWNCFFESLGLQSIADLHNYVAFVFLAYILIRSFYNLGVIFNKQLLLIQAIIIIVYFGTSIIYQYELSNILYQLYYFSVPFFAMHLILCIDNFRDFSEVIASKSLIIRIILTLMYAYTFLHIRYNTTAEAMIMSYALLPIALFGFIPSNNHKVLNYLSGSTACLALLAFGNRAMIVCIFAFFMMFFAIKLLHTKKGLFILLSLVFVFLVIFLFIKNNVSTVVDFLYGIKNSLNAYGTRTEIIDQVVSLIKGTADNIWHERDVLAASSYKAIIDNPVGWGIGGSRYAMQIYYGAYIYPHNLFLEFLIDYGVVLGPILIIVLAVYTLKTFLSKTEKSLLFFLAILFSCGILKLFMSDSYLSSFSFWIFIAFYPILKKSYKKPSKILIIPKRRAYEGVNYWN